MRRAAVLTGTRNTQAVTPNVQHTEVVYHCVTAATLVVREHIKGTCFLDSVQYMLI
jgi:hypothetical protein